MARAWPDAVRYRTSSSDMNHVASVRPGGSSADVAATNQPLGSPSVAARGSTWCRSASRGSSSLPSMVLLGGRAREARRVGLRCQIDIEGLLDAEHRDVGNERHLAGAGDDERRAERITIVGAGRLDHDL